MQSAIRTVLAPMHYWRTFLLMLSVGFAVAAISRNVVAIWLSTMACAFVFRSHETRRWIMMAADRQAADIFLRALLAFLTMLIVCATPAHL